jgi:type IV secretion system protein VirB1
MILPLAVVTHLSTACAPEVAPEMLAGIARVESRLDPFAIHDNTTGRSYWPRDKAEAIRIAVPLLAAGHSIDAGLMGINAGNWRWLGLDAETVFDPCRNIRAGATVLTALSRYNTGSPTRGFHDGYVQHVVAAGHALPPVSVHRAAPIAPVPPPSPDQPAVQPPGQPAGQARGLKADRWLKADRGLKVHRGRLWRAYTSSQEPDSWSAFSSSEGKRS